MTSKKLNLQELNVEDLNNISGGSIIAAFAFTVAVGSFFFNAGYNFAAAQ